MRNFRFTILSLLLLVVATTQAQAQSTQLSTVTGKIVDAITKEPLAGVGIIRDTLSGTGVTTDAQGEFKLTRVPIGKELKVLVSYIGYHDLELSITPPTAEYRLSPDVPLSTSNVLDEVVIYGSAPVAEIKGDTTQFNAGAYKTNPDASTSDLIAKMPGFVQNSDGSVTKDGETVTKVLVDGKNYFRDDVATALNSLPADVVESIQFIDDQTDESKFTGYDDGERVKTINIVTKTKQKSALLGEYYAGYGLGTEIGADNPYVASLNTNYFTQKDILSVGFGANNINTSPISQRGFYGRGGTTGISEQLGAKLNYDRQIKGGSISATYTYLQNDNVAESFTDAINTSVGLNQLSYDTTLTNSQRHNFNIYYEQQINDKNKLIFRPSFSYTTTDLSSSLFQNYLYDSDIYNNVSSSSLTNTQTTNYSIRPMLQWFHNFNPKQFFTLTGRGTFSNNDQDKYLNSDIRTFLETGYEDSLSNQQIQDLTASNYIDGSATFTQRLGTLSTLNVRYGISYDWSDNDKKTYMWDEDQLAYVDINDDLSNEFARNYLNNTVSLGYGYNAKGVHIVNVGLGYKHSDLQNQMLYPDLLPKENYTYQAPTLNFNYRYRLDKSKSLDFMLRTDSQLPSITQLQNVLDVSNPLSVSIGNPELDQAYRSNIMGRYRTTNVEKSTSFTAYIRGTQTQNSFATNRTILTEDKIVNGVLLKSGTTLSTPTNLDGYWLVSTGGNYAFPFKAIKSSVNMSFGYDWSRQPGIDNNISYIANENELEYRVSLSSNITPEIDFQIISDSEYTNVASNLKDDAGNSYDATNNFEQTVGVKLNWIFWKGFFVNVDYSYKYNYLSNIDASQYEPSQNILNAAIGKKFMNNNLEVRVSGYDLLAQYQNIRSTVNGSIVSDVFSNSLTRYITFSVQYKINTLSAAQGVRQQQQRGPGGGPGMMKYR